MSRIRVCHIITGLETGGAETQLLRLHENEGMSDVDSMVVSLRTEGDIGPRLSSLGVPVHALHMFGIRHIPAAIMRLRRILSDFSPEVIIGWMYHANLAATMVSKTIRRSPPIIWNIRHSLHAIQLEKPRTRLLIKLGGLLSQTTDSIIYNSATSRTQHESIGFARQRGKIIPNGFDLSLFKFDVSARRELRTELGIPLDAPVVGNVARYHPLKNHAGFLQAGKILLKQLPDTHFLLVGKDLTWDNKQLVEGTIGIPSTQLHLVGQQKQLRRFYSAMDILCNPSMSEGFPSVVGEAMACERPCLVSDVGASADLIGDTGRLSNPNDIEDIAEQMAILLQDNGLLALGTSARARIKENYSIEAARLMYHKHLIAAARPG